MRYDDGMKAGFGPAREFKRRAEQALPGRIKKVFPIDVAHPRDRADPVLKDLTEQVRAQILDAAPAKS